MKKPIFTLLLTLCLGALFGQSNNLQHVIVMMAERYDDSQISQRTALMTKEQRRNFVIAERKAFCQASQAQVLDFLEGYKNENLVSDLKTFWSFNGFSCSASAEVIAQLAQRKDVAMIIPDEMRPMIPNNEKARPATTRDNAWHVGKVNAPAVWNYNGTQRLARRKSQRACGLELQRHGLYGQRRHHRPHRHRCQLQPRRYCQQSMGRRQRVP